MMTERERRLAPFLFDACGRTQVVAGVRDTDGCRVIAVRLEKPLWELAPGRMGDEFGVLWRTDGGAAVPEGHPVPDADALAAYRFPEVQTGFIEEKLDAFRDAPEEVLRVCTIPAPCLGRAERLAGRGVLHRAMRGDAAFAHTLLRRCCEHTLRVMDAALQFDFDVLRLEERWENADGTPMEPDVWRACVKPYLARLYAMGKAYRKPIIQAGADAAFLGELSELGVDMMETP